MTRCPDQVNVGAYVLDVLEPDERERMRRHLDGCSACAGDRLELAALPGRLASVRAADVLGAAQPVRPSELAFRRLQAAARGPAWRRRARAPTVAAAAVLVGVVAAVAAGVRDLRTPDVPPQPDVVTAASGVVHARAALTPTHNGTRVVLTLAGVPAREQCRLVAVGRSGQRQTASTWTATYDGDASVTGWLSLPPDQIDRLVVETLGGAALLTLPSPEA